MADYSFKVVKAETNLRHKHVSKEITQEICFTCFFIDNMLIHTFPENTSVTCDLFSVRKVLSCKVQHHIFVRSYWQKNAQSPWQNFPTTEFPALLWLCLVPVTGCWWKKIKLQLGIFWVVHDTTWISYYPRSSDVPFSAKLLLYSSENTKCPSLKDFARTLPAELQEGCQYCRIDAVLMQP